MPFSWEECRVQLPKTIVKRQHSDFGENHDPRRTKSIDLTHAALREPDLTQALQTPAVVYWLRKQETQTDQQEQRVA
jgi:adenylate kinase